MLELGKRGSVAIGIAAALSVVLALPALMLPWEEDEVFLAAAARGASPWMNTPFDLYRFSSGNPAEVQEYVARGAFPWFTDASFKYAPWRPLASALYTLDVQLWGAHRWPAQLHSILWHLAFVMAGIALLRRALTASALPYAAIALVFMPALVGPTTWLTNRHVFVGLVPAVLALLAHLRWREEGGPRNLALSVAGYAIAFLGSEAGFTFAPYLMAYELVGRRDSSRARIRALLPWACVALAYTLIFVGLDRGGYVFDAYSGDFLTLRELSFRASSVPIMIAVLLTGSTGYHLHGLPVYGPRLLLVLAVLAGFWRWRRGHERGAERRSVLWLALGMCGSVFLVCMVRAYEARALVPASIGGAAVIGVVAESEVSRLVTAIGGRTRRIALQGAMVASLAALLVLPVLEFPVRHWMPNYDRSATLGKLNTSWAKLKGIERAFVLGAPYWLPGQLAAAIAHTLGHEQVPEWHLLSLDVAGLTVRRPARTILELEEAMPSPSTRFYGEPSRIRPGMEVQTTAAKVSVRDATHETARAYQVEIPSLGDRRTQLVTIADWSARVIELPDVGESRVLTPTLDLAPKPWAVRTCGQNLLTWAVFACEHALSNRIFMMLLPSFD